MTNEEKFDEILDETDEFFKKKLIEAYGLDDKKTKICGPANDSVSDMYDALGDCYFHEEDENCKYCASYGVCKTLDELDYYEWKKLKYKGPAGYTSETETATTTAISKDGISW